MTTMRFDVVYRPFFRAGDKAQPPGRMTIGSRLRTSHKIAFTYDAEDLAICINDRGGTYSTLQQ
tara:strand:+ start:704 stop:895 length:192 start_codon:yes stop_codon:yes gene_type:complete